VFKEDNMLNAESLRGSVFLQYNYKGISVHISSSTYRKIYNYYTKSYLQRSMNGHMRRKINYISWNRLYT